METSASLLSPTHITKKRQTVALLHGARRAQHAKLGGVCALRRLRKESSVGMEFRFSIRYSAVVPLPKVLVLVPACAKSPKCPAVDPRGGIRRLNSICLGELCAEEGCGVRDVVRLALRARELGIDVLVKIVVSYDEVAQIVELLRPDAVVGMACDAYSERGARELGSLAETIPISLGPGCKSREVPEVYSDRLQRVTFIGEEHRRALWSAIESLPPQAGPSARSAAPCP